MLGIKLIDTASDVNSTDCKSKWNKTGSGVRCGRIFYYLGMCSVRKHIQEKFVFQKKDDTDSCTKHTFGKIVRPGTHKSGRSTPKRLACNNKVDITTNEDSERVRKKMNEEAFTKWFKMKQKEELERREAKKLEEERKEIQRLQKEEDDKRFAALNRAKWLERKLAAQAAERERRKKEEKQLEENEILKKNLSKEVVSVWMGITRSRPKPASSNIFRPAKVNVSFVNPKPWRGVLDD